MNDRTMTRRRPHIASQNSGVQLRITNQLSTYFKKKLTPSFHYCSDHYGYVTTLKHSPSSRAAAKGIRVTWMLAPFIKFLNIVSYTGPKPPKVLQKDDSVTLKVSWKKQNAHCSDNHLKQTFRMLRHMSSEVTVNYVISVTAYI